MRLYKLASPHWGCVEGAREVAHGSWEQLRHHVHHIPAIRHCLRRLPMKHLSLKLETRRARVGRSIENIVSNQNTVQLL
jgi:hypothetical protein